MARRCGGRRGQKVGPLPACHSIVVRNSPHHPPPGQVMNSQREAGQTPKAVLRGDPHLSATDRCESGLKPVLGCCQTVLACARARAWRCVSWRLSLPELCPIVKIRHFRPWGSIRSSKYDTFAPRDPSDCKNTTLSPLVLHPIVKIRYSRSQNSVRS